LPNELWLAGAGAGKTNKIITDAIEIIRSGGRVLVVTYTTNNQAELRARFVKIYGTSSELFVVKGLFTFYLEDLIRPYQNVIFAHRIATILFTENNPHLDPKTTYYIPGRAEKSSDGTINPLHYLTACKTKAYSGLLAKLATRIASQSTNAPAKRLKGIYQKIFFDEVQDLVGWDYDVIRSLSDVMADAIYCVGDFRQTIYETTFGHKSPVTPSQKIDYFVGKMKFEKFSMPHNRRCIQEICDLSDSIHQGQYDKTISAVTKIPAELAHHSGIFIVKLSQVTEYLAAFQPQVLRWSSATGTAYLPSGIRCYTFGFSKGLGFDRVLIIPTEKHMKFFCGDTTVFAKEKTDQAQNKLYVSITRARYSLAILVEDKLAKNLPYPMWEASASFTIAKKWDVLNADLG
jgi:DNA helicase II / ATP-dependent DNA helicase PcrA